MFEEDFQQFVQEGYSGVRHSGDSSGAFIVFAWSIIYFLGVNSKGEKVMERRTKLNNTGEDMFKGVNHIGEEAIRWNNLWMREKIPQSTMKEVKRGLIG